jgi:hypothetical protein
MNIKSCIPVWWGDLVSSHIEMPLYLAARYSVRYFVFTRIEGWMT